MKDKSSPTLCPTARLFTVALLTASGCTLPNLKQIDYQSTESATGSKLEIPPDMGRASHSEPESLSRHTLAPVSGMHIERADHAHWLVVDDKTPEQLWPQLQAFWQAQGFELAVDERARGRLETDWKTSRPRLKQGMLRDTLSKVERLGNAYITSEKNKYLTRVISKADGRTWISIQHQGQREMLTGVAKEMSQWQPAPNDPSLEVEFVQRLMYALAAQSASRSQRRSEQRLKSVLPASPPLKPARRSPQALIEMPAALDLQAAFDQAWPQVGLALERANFTIAARDRARGVYTIRYVMPAKPPTQQGSFWRRIFEKKSAPQVQRYLLKVQALHGAETRIFIADTVQEGVDPSKQARVILRLLAEQLAQEVR